MYENGTVVMSEKDPIWGITSLFLGCENEVFVMSATLYKQFRNDREMEWLIAQH